MIFAAAAILIATVSAVVLAYCAWVLRQSLRKPQSQA
jgi:hypothetical protein